MLRKGNGGLIVGYVFFIELVIKNQNVLHCSAVIFLQVMREVFSSSCVSMRRLGSVVQPLVGTMVDAWQHGHFYGFALGSPVRLRWRRPLAKTNVFALELRSRPRRGAICRQEPGDRDGLGRYLCSEPRASDADAFIRDDYAPFGQQILDIAQAQGKTEALQARLCNLANYERWLCGQSGGVNNMTKPLKDGL